MSVRARDPEPADEWQEILYYGGLEAPNTSRVLEDFDLALTEAMSLLEQQILGEEAPEAVQ